MLPSGETCFLKHVLPGPGWRDQWKRRLGRSPAAREFRTLRRLRSAGVPVPETLALFESSAGDSILVTRFVAGESLDRALEGPASTRRLGVGITAPPLSASSRRPAIAR